MGKLTEEQIENGARAMYESRGYNWANERNGAVIASYRNMARAAAPHLQSRPEPVSGDLLDRAMRSYQMSVKQHGFELDPDESAAPVRRAAIQAIIRVVLDEALQAPTNEERTTYERSGSSLTNYYGLSDMIAMLHERKSRLLRPKSPEERVTYSQLAFPKGSCLVRLDGKDVINLHSEEHARIYRLGLIAKLKEEESEP